MNFGYILSMSCTICRFNRCGSFEKLLMAHGGIGVTIILKQCFNKLNSDLWSYSLGIRFSIENLLLSLISDSTSFVLLLLFQ